MDTLYGYLYNGIGEYLHRDNIVCYNYQMNLINRFGYNSFPVCMGI